MHVLDYLVLVGYFLMMAAIGLFFIGILAGILIGVILSLLLLIASASGSPVRRMGLDTANDVFVDADKYPEAETIPGIVVAEIHGPLFFADVENFRSSVMGMVEKEEPHTVVILVGVTQPFEDLDRHREDNCRGVFCRYLSQGLHVP